MSQSVLGVLLASFTPIKPHQQPWSWANTSQVHKSAYRQLGCAFIKSKAMKTCSGWQFQSFLLDLKRSPGEHRLLINFNCWAVEGCPLFNIIWCKQLWHRAAEMFLASRVLLNAKLNAAEVLLFSEELRLNNWIQQVKKRKMECWEQIALMHPPVNVKMLHFRKLRF